MPLASSFRDPAGNLFSREGVLYRQVLGPGLSDYQLLMDSGLYKTLVKKELLIPHEEVDVPGEDPDAKKVLKPELLPFISYPYEWCFSQLKDAALLTLRIQKLALKKGLSLKDASAYNVQFRQGKPIFLDTLSFEALPEGQPWKAYRQFCQHFLAPLLLMSYVDTRLGRLSQVHLDGIPLDLTSSLLPRSTYLNLSVLTHVHLHSSSQKKHEHSEVRGEELKVSETGLLGILDNLKSLIQKLSLPKSETEWGDYYDNTNYSDDAFEAKKKLVAKMVEAVEGKTFWDLGANLGVFSRVAASVGKDVLSMDLDPNAVEANYLQVKKTGETSVLPLLIDLTNPSPGIGWEHKERDSLLERGPADGALALGLVHHLAISNNLPFERIASFFLGAAKSLVVEFIPRGDSQVEKLLATREGEFQDYTPEAFEAAFEKVYALKDKQPIEGSKRTLYRWEPLSA